MKSYHEKDAELVSKTQNTARFFTEQRHVSWILLIATVLWGIFGYLRMPKLKDPLIEVRQAVAIVPWPGASPQKIEDLVTRKLEDKMAENTRVEKIESTTRGSTAVVYVTIQEGTSDVGKEFDDIKGKLDAINDLPEGAGPITFIKDFGDTSALMLTVASPQVGAVEIGLRAKALAKAINAVRPSGAAGHSTIIVCFPTTASAAPIVQAGAEIARELQASGVIRSSRSIQGAGFIGLDVETTATDAVLRERVLQFARQTLRLSELHPDVWQPAVVHDVSELEARLSEVAGDQFSYRDLERQTDLLRRHLLAMPMVAKVQRSGVLAEKIFLDYSQEKLAAYSLDITKLKDVIAARNINMPGGVVEIGAKSLGIDPSGELQDEGDIGGVIMAASARGTPVYLRDIVDVVRTYESPARFLNSYTTGSNAGQMHQHRAITIAIQMRRGQQIGAFGEAVDAKLAELKPLLGDGLILARTSDQPLQVEENVHLFMSTLYEAIALVVIVALIGFWEWRSALLMALSIPVTLAMTFGLMALLGLDVQQVSIASLILALGLLVDDPVVAGDAIKRALGEGWKPLIAAWLGPTKLATAIMFATITNIVAYLPFVLLKGDTGSFIFSLPIVLTCSLVASRIVSMTFLPLLGYYLLRAAPKANDTEKDRKNVFLKAYYVVGNWAINHRKAVVAGAVVLLAGALAYSSQLKTSFFPSDLSYLAYVDVWLPEDVPLSSTRQIATQVEGVIGRVSGEYGRSQGRQAPILHSLTTFVGGGGPRFWFSVTPEMRQTNYAQILLQVNDRHDLAKLVPQLQQALDTEIAGALVDVRQLETGKPVGIPVAVRISGEDPATLRRLAADAKAIFRAIPIAARTRDDWGAEAMKIRMNIDPDRANVMGLTNYDVAASSAAAMNGYQLSSLREGHLDIPILARMRSTERARLADVSNLYVRGRNGPDVPLQQVAHLAFGLETAKIRRRNHFPTITVATFPVAGHYASEVIAAAQPALDRLASQLPVGYHLEVGGEKEEQVRGFTDLAGVLAVSVLAIFVALVVQFRNAVKPLIVFAAIPFGVAGALVSLTLMDSPFGFMAFLGIISLIGVIVSHIIVLFDFIEEKREEGVPLQTALLDAGILRLRPVLITVGATVLGLFPLAAHGGPLWEPLCYAQIGGLSVATVLTLLLVPVIYAIFVLDLKWVGWTPSKEDSHAL